MAEPPLRIGVTCFSTFGGSGAVASAIGLGMAERGHQVHFVCHDIPVRLPAPPHGLTFHEVDVPEYPLFKHPPYALALTSKLVEVCEHHAIDILHMHYAVPHATSAYLARQILRAPPKVVTTLHGTDITLVGRDANYLPITRFSILESDGVTVPSEFLRDATRRQLGIDQSFPIEVISNFVDETRFTPAEGRSFAGVAHLFGADADRLEGARVLTHISNFRPIKRLEDVVRVFAAVNREVPAVLVLVGDGPERSRAEASVRELGLAGRTRCLGKRQAFVELLQNSDLFLLPSEQESFGLAALEALSCGVPVIASRVGGIPEVVAHGETGFLADVGDVEAMAQAAVRLLRDGALHERMSQAARAAVLRRWRHKPMLDRYEAYYRGLLNRQPTSAKPNC